MPGVHDFRTEGDHVAFQLDGQHSGAVMRALADAEIVSLEANPPSLEALFLSQYGDAPSVASS
jgi:ABC-2 type transport system ATP-binding protein